LRGEQHKRDPTAGVWVQTLELILASEPVSSVDPTLASTIVRLLIDISESTRNTLVVSLHSVDLALAYFPRVIGVKDGRAAFDLAADKISDAMLEELYDGSIRENGAQEAASEPTSPIAYPSIS